MVLELLRNYVKWSYMANFVDKNEVYSTILVAPPESAKSFSLTFYKYRKAKVISDITYYGLAGLLQEIANKNVRVIIIPELIKLISRDKATSNNLLSLINELTDEGVVSLQTYYFRQDFPKPLKAGFIMAVNSYIFEKMRRAMVEMGTISRFVIFSYQLSKETISYVYEAMRSEKKEKKPVLRPIRRKVKIPAEIDMQLEELSKRMAPILLRHPKNTSIIPTYSFRLYRSLRLLAKAIAVDRKKSEVSEEELNTILELNRYFNYGFNEI